MQSPVVAISREFNWTITTHGNYSTYTIIEYHQHHNGYPKLWRSVTPEEEKYLVQGTTDMYEIKYGQTRQVTEMVKKFLDKDG